MINKDQAVESHNKEIASMFDDLSPFSITINNGHDAAWISSAIMQYLISGSVKQSRDAMQLLLHRCHTLGVDQGVDEMLDALKESHIKHPPFIGPVFKLMISHALIKYQQHHDKNE